MVSQRYRRDGLLKNKLVESLKKSLKYIISNFNMLVRFFLRKNS
jgi:hypothetical protein